MQPYTDTHRTIYTNCTIITCDPARPQAEAMVTESGEVVAAGQKEDLWELAGSGARTIDLDGATVVPGFDDCHMHILSFGLSLRQVDLGAEKVGSIEAIRLSVGEATTQSPRRESWILGRGYNQHKLAERRHPTRDDLDSVSGGHPVVLWHTSGHVLCANSAALDVAGIGPATNEPAGGEIDRDGAGRPTGILKERAMDLMRTAIPAPARDEARDAILDASSALAREGITSASDAATGQHMGLSDELEAYKSAVETERLYTRLVLMPLAQQTVTTAGATTSLSRAAAGQDVMRPEWLRIGAMKIFSDGALTTRTAAMRTPYLDTGGSGILTWLPRELTEIVQEGAQLGWDIATHAIGDRAVEQVLNAYESLGEHHRGRRLRIEHCTICDHELIARLQKLSVIPVLQPEDITVLGDAYPAGLGPVRAAENSPVGWFREAGLEIAFSSDRPVTPGNPLVGIRAAVERKTASGMVLGPNHCVSAEAAIRYYTRGSAVATRCENFKGMLSPGMRADFVVVDRDITRCAAEDITATEVLMTVSDGRVAYER